MARRGLPTGPFLRGAVELGARTVALAGFGPVSVERFDWQPSGSERLLTTIASGVSQGHGFWFALHVAMETGDVFMTDPTPLVTSIRCDGL